MTSLNQTWMARPEFVCLISVPPLCCSCTSAAPLQLYIWPRSLPVCRSLSNSSSVWAEQHLNKSMPKVWSATRNANPYEAHVSHNISGWDVFTFDLQYIKGGGGWWRLNSWNCLIQLVGGRVCPGLGGSGGRMLFSCHLLLYYLREGGLPVTRD